MPVNNRKQVFADLVSLEAWHDEFTTSNSRAPLSANIVFGQANMGAGEHSKITFRLRVKRAELVVIIGNDPARIDPREVARFITETKIQRKILREKERSGAVKGEASAGASLKTGPSLGAKASAEGELRASRKETIEQSEELSVFEITQSKDNDQNYRWIIEHIDGEALDGAPWDPAETPLATIIDKRGGKKTSLAPTVQLAVRCRREDLVIEDLQVKKPETVKGWNKDKKMEDVHRANILAAEALIRNRLTEYGLHAPDISEEFSQIILGRVFAEALPVKKT